MRSSIRLAAFFASFVCVVTGCSSSEERAPNVMPSRPSSEKGGGSAGDFAAQLAKDTGVTWLVSTNEEYGTPSFVEPKTDGAVALAPGADPETTARAWLTRYASFYRIDDVAKELELETVDKASSLGFTNVAFRQIVHGVHVDATRITVHFDRAGHIAFVNSTFAPRAREVATTPALDATRATDIARAAFGKTPRPSSRAPELLVEPHARKLVWRLTLTSNDDARTFDVDAVSGAVVATRSAYNDATTTLAVTGSRGPYDIEIDAPVSGQYALRRSPDEAGARPPILCGDHRTSATYTSTDGKSWDDTAGDPDRRAAIDAYAHVAMVESWYRTQVSWSSYDNQGSPIFVWMHACSQFNARWMTADEMMEICDGDRAGKIGSLATAPDVIAHELQHGITHATLGLKYQAQSGALNESLSDVFGIVVEFETGTGEGRFIGENSISPPLRDMRDPPSLGQPDRMSSYSDVPVDQENDWGGVHDNSGIPNKVFSLFVGGGRHEGSGVDVGVPMGFRVARDVYWELVRGRAVGPEATFEEFALAHANIARRTSDDALHTSVCAWRAVEVFDDDTTKSRWDITCNPHLSCLAGTHPCDAGRRCAWNGQDTGYCCRVPKPGNEQTDLCLRDSDCPSGKICSYGRDNLLMCQDPEAGDDTCERPPGSAR